jgi:ribonuclease P protein component
VPSGQSSSSQRRAPANDQPDQRFPRCARLTAPSDFQRVFASRVRVSNDTLLLYARKNNLPRSRLGLSVSRKLGNAVVRNRWKRRLREAFRLARRQLPSGLDLVVIPRLSNPPALACLQQSLVALAARIEKKLERHDASSS